VVKQPGDLAIKRKTENERKAKAEYIGPQKGRKASEYDAEAVEENAAGSSHEQAFQRRCEKGAQEPCVGTFIRSM
jgi:hypothetical protein